MALLRSTVKIREASRAREGCCWGLPGMGVSKNFRRRGRNSLKPDKENLTEFVLLRSNFQLGKGPGLKLL
jgi:hypothetical protein